MDPRSEHSAASASRVKDSPSSSDGMDKTEDRYPGEASTMPTTPIAPPRGAIPAQARTIDQVRTRTAIPQQPRRRSRTFGALVVASQRRDQVMLAQVLADNGAAPLVLASSCRDFLEHNKLPTKSGLAAISAAPQHGATLQAISELRRRGWRRIALFSNKADVLSVRVAIAAKVRVFCVVAPNDHRESGDSDRSSAAGLQELSHRELDVLQAIADGYSNKGVGDKLGLSPLTIKSHMARIGRKLGVGDRAQMVAMAMRAGLIS